jgi:hypothetical protein
LIVYDKYALSSREQLEFEEDVIALFALAYTPLLLVKHGAYIHLIMKRDPRPKTTTEMVKNVQHMLTHVPSVSLLFDLWMKLRLTMHNKASVNY